MSTTRQVTIWCDHPRCTRWIVAMEDDTVTEARTDARMRGWRTGVADPNRAPASNPRLDFCPEHARADS